MISRITLTVLIFLCGLFMGCHSATEDKTDVVKQTVIDRHNHCRANVDPASTTALADVTWDDTLAAFAKNWAATQPCGNPSHSKKADGRTEWGENLSMGSGSASYYDSDQDLKDRAEKGVDGWCNEKADYTLSSNSCQTGKVCGHYTQVVWDRSTKIGCGFVVCDTGDSQVPKGYNLVCEYKAQGNYEGCKPYNRVSGDGCEMPNPCVNGTATEQDYGDYILKTTNVCDPSVNEYCTISYNTWFRKSDGAYAGEGGSYKNYCT